MKALSIDVITPVLNGEKLLERCVQSVQQSGYPSLTHTLVVDARCRDQSAALARKLAAKCSNVRFILDEGTSAAAAINHGFAKTEGEVITWLGHDNMWLQETPWEVNDCLGSRRETDFLFGAVLIVDENGIAERTRLPLPGMDLIDLYFSQFIPSQEGCFWRRRIHQVLSEEYKSGFDHDLWLRFFAEEIAMISTDKTLAIFEKRAGQLSADRDRYSREMNMARMSLAAQRLGGQAKDYSGRWQQLDFLARDSVGSRLLEKRKVALSPRIDRMPGAIGEFFFYAHGPGELEIVSSKVETRLITICDQSGPIRAQKIRGTEGRFCFKADKPGFYFVDISARGKEDASACRLRCDEVRWNGESILRKDTCREVSPDCPVYRF